MLEAILIIGAIIGAHKADFAVTGPRFIKINVLLLANGLFAAAAGMITFGVAIGKVTPLQMLVLLVLEVPLYAANAFLVFEHFFVPMGATDAGGAMIIHAFGAYFGLAATWRIARDKPEVGAEHVKNGANYNSNLTSMIGTLFLWIMWPSFNAYLTGAAKMVAIINTLISISGATLLTFAVSVLFGGKLDMVHIQNSTLAGGVAMGAVPHLRMGPGAALLVGCFAGALSTVGYSKISPWLEVHVGIRDTCGVNNLHGMPGILGGVVGIITLASLDGSTAALNELYTLLSTLAISLSSGLACGELIRHINVYGSERDRINLAFEDSALMMTDPQKLAVP